jgi:predicted amidohydrolase
MTSTKSFRAAVVQTLAVLGRVDENIRLLRHFTAEAVRQKAQLVVFPECMNTGYLFDSAAHCRALAEPLDGRFVQAMAGLARHHGVHIASGITELDTASGRAFNSGVLLDPRGDIAIHYQKQFLATHDHNWFDVGVRGCPVVETELGRIGLLICFDGRIPEITRLLALQGAEVVVDMANFFAMDQADMWVPARAYENGVWFVAATKAGVERSIYYPGGSLIVGPDGHVKARMANDTHGVLSAEIVPTEARRKRWPGEGDRFADRRPRAYHLLGRPFHETPASQYLAEPLVPERALAKVAAVQAHATQTAPDGGASALEMVAHAGKLGVDIVVLPLFVSCPSWAPSVPEAQIAAASAPSLVRHAAQIAQEYGCVVVWPHFELEGELVPTAVVIGPDGTLIGRQRQVHLEPSVRAFCRPGSEFTVFDTPYGRLGVVLGYDGLFPESSRALALAGADIIAWPAAWRHPRERGLLAVPKAEDNRVYVVCANRSDAPSPGGSLVIPPTGFPDWNLERVAPPVMRHGAVMPMHANLALARQKNMIPKVDLLRNRLVGTYGPLTTEQT